MPCPDLRGVEFVDEMVTHYFQNNWSAALYAFVSDLDNLWCPKWVRHNYEVQNELDFLSDDPTDVSKQHECPQVTQPVVPRKNPEEKCFPHQKDKTLQFEFEDDEPGGEQKEQKPNDSNAHWVDSNREPWQCHSGLGPNLNAHASNVPAEPRPNNVNPLDHQWTTCRDYFHLHEPDVFWGNLKSSSTNYRDPTLTLEALEDDHQSLFVRLVLEHCRKYWDNSISTDTIKPLRLFLFGTAGTGKTRAVRTCLQLLQTELEKVGWSTSFVRGRRCGRM